jgi:hypothetical protein
MIEADCYSIYSVQNHACKGDNDRNYDTNRYEASCKCSVLCFLLVAKHLKRIEEITHLYYVFYLLHFLGITYKNNIKVLRFKTVYKEKCEIYDLSSFCLSIIRDEAKIRSKEVIKKNEKTLKKLAELLIQK